MQYSIIAEPDQTCTLINAMPTRTHMIAVNGQIQNAIHNSIIVNLAMQDLRNMLIVNYQKENKMHDYATRNLVVTNQHTRYLLIVIRSKRRHTIL